MTDWINQKRGVVMPRTEEANQRIREEQRAKILDAAWKVFGKKGMAATMAEIAVAADVSYGLVYRYFTSKEAIFQALVEHLLQFGVERIQYILDMPGTPGERLDFMISKVLEARRERPEFFLLFYQILSDEKLPEDFRERISKQGRTYQDKVKQLIIEGQVAGEVAQGDPGQMVTAIMACLDGLSRLALRDPEQFKNHFPDAEIILRMLKP
jgi:AcrR family transcriptional regulator